MKTFLQAIIRLFVVTVINGLSLLLTAWTFSGIAITVPDENSGVLVAAMSVAIVLAILNGLVRPLLILLTLPINIITLGLFTLVINALMLMLTSYFLPFFEVDGFWAALGGALIRSAVNTLLTGLKDAGTWLMSGFKALIVINGYIFLSPILLMIALSLVMRVAGAMGEVEMAASHVIMQYMLLISLGLDGFAHAAEALAGSAWG